MPYRRYIPKQLKLLHPKLTMPQLRAVINNILNNKTQVLAQNSVFNVRLKGIGNIRTHKSKLPKNVNKMRYRDKIKKRNKQKKLELTKERLLW